MKVERLVGIIMILLDKKRVGARELADMFEVSPRTIYRDVDAINLAGIPIRATSGVGGGFEIMEGYKVDKKVFTTADLSAILMGLANMSGMVRGEELVNALAKVRSFIPADRAKEIEVRANQILIDLSPWTGNRNIQPYLEIVKTATQERRLLSFSYTDHRSAATVRTVEPCRLVLKGNHWYWQGYCRTRKDFRLFKLSRMSSLRMLEETFAPRECPTPRLDIEDIVAPMQTTITLRVHASAMDRVLDFCEYERFTPDGRDHYLVAFPFIENDYHYDVLLGLGPKCECLGPPHIREGLRQRARKLAGMYKD